MVATVPPNREELRRMLLAIAMLQAQQGRQPQMQNAPQQSDIDKWISYAKKAKGMYDDGKQIYDAGSSIYNYFAQPAYTEATNAAWNQAAGEASQAAWNAGADTATNAAAEGANTAGSQAGETAGGNYAGWAAAAMSAYNSGKNLTGDNLRDEEKAYEAAMAVPRAAAAYYTGGLSTLAEGYARKQWGGTMKKLDKLNQNNPASPMFGFMQASKLWTSDKWKTEGNRLKKLLDAGINIPQELQGTMLQRRGRTKKELINPYLPKDFVGNTPQYGWVNNKFADSRKEGDLTGRDIWGYSAFFDKYGNDWLGKFNEQQREAIANKALQRGAVREHHGTIDINWTPDLENDVKSVTGANYKIPKAPVPVAPSQPTQPLRQPAVQQGGIKGILARARR